MPAPKLFTDEQLSQMVQEGMEPAAIAKRLGVHPNSVYKRLKRMRVAVSREAALFGPSRQLLERQLETADYIVGMCKQASQILDMAQVILDYDYQPSNTPEYAAYHDARGKLLRLVPRSKGGEPDLMGAVLKAHDQLRKHRELDFRIKTELMSLKAVADFQIVVMEEIGKLNPVLRDTIVRRLVELNAARSSLDIVSKAVGDSS